MVSRQREWQKKQIEDGKCKICAKKRNTYAQYCDDHQAWYRKYYREYMRVNPKVIAGKGRPIKEVEKENA